MSHQDLYIHDRGNSVRVVFPQSILPKRHHSTHEVVNGDWEAARRAARHARDAFLAERDSIIPARPAVSFQDITIPANTAGFEDTPLTVPGGSALVFCDTHVPHHNRLMLKRAIYTIRRYFPHIEDFIVAGDSWDWSSLSKHPKDAPGEDIDQSLEVGADMYRNVGDYFNRAWVCNGNHDARIGLKLDKPFNLKRVFNSAFGQAWPTCQMNISNLDYLYVDHADPSRRWMIGHPSHYNGAGGTTAAAIADLEGMNVATAHSHVVGMQQSKSGKYLGVDVGHMTDPERHYYIKRRMTKFPKWSAGFLVISDGMPYHFTEKWTDWPRLGCL